MTEKHKAGGGMAIDTQRLRELIAKATPGPWNSMTYRNGSHRVGHGPNYIVADIYWPADGSDAQVNATLIAETRNALPALLNHIDAQTAEIARLKKALRVAVLALAHATQEHGKVYEPAYKEVDAAINGGQDD